MKHQGSEGLGLRDRGEGGVFRTLLVDFLLLAAVLLTPVLELAGQSCLRPRDARAFSTLRPPTVSFRARNPDVLVLALCVY